MTRFASVTPDDFEISPGGLAHAIEEMVEGLSTRVEEDAFAPHQTEAAQTELAELVALEAAADAIDTEWVWLEANEPNEDGEAPDGPIVSFAGREYVVVSPR